MNEGEDHKEPPLEEAIERLERAEVDLAHARADEARAEHEIDEALAEIKATEHPKPFDLIINRKDRTWPHPEIDGRQIKELAESPADWVVNQIVDGPGEDPEIGDNQMVPLAHDAEPKGIKRFTTRKPKTSPGAQ